ncbi:Glycosyl transferase family 2 [Rhodococcus maanshanensis]|uniref:Glycosyl transferase family 2 n=1 Tax=Rhodococcus maanshanensis TaxID=183556 RepID=A0A1H7PIK1_9NOCA|nr:Glycosyl transferase family 2 [Rhodococcus maanshanensis]
MIIPAYNAKHTIDAQLSALAAQDYPGGFEVIVSDNGSTDGLQDHIRNHPLAQDLTLSVVDSSTSPGAAHARNVGIYQAKGDFLAFCDADDQAHRQWLSALVEAAPASDAVAGTVETYTLNSAEVQRWLPMPDPSERPMLFGWKPSLFSGSFGMWRTTSEAVDGFDERYARGGEDNDLALRIHLAGLSLAHAPEALVSVRLRSTFRDVWRQMVKYGEADAKVYAAYVDQGVPRRPRLAVFVEVLRLTLTNPLLPQRISGTSRGHWVQSCAHLVGRTIGSVKYRTYFL